MFKKTKNEQQLNLFSNAYGLLSKKALVIYNDENSWHNQFRMNTLSKIDEEPFRPLFCQVNGAPNASIRLSIGMMIIKEAHGLSDSQLFERCQFDIVYRSALGIFNFDAPIPAASTYYLLRQRIVEWEKAGNENLIEKVFSQVTHDQIIQFKINGKKVRIDSKLLGSNIAWLSRYELIHETVRLVLRAIKDDIDKVLSDSDKLELQEIFEETASTVSYYSTTEELKDKITKLGPVIYRILKYYKDSSISSIETLRNVFEENYEVIDEIVNPLSKEALKSDRIESPHDTDSRFRKKGTTQAKGFSVNIIETCDKDNPLDLITSTIVAPANVSDCYFFQEAIEATQETTNQKVETANVDGGYYSKDNVKYCNENEIDFILSDFPAPASRYDIHYFDGEKLELIDTQTNVIIPTNKTQSRKTTSEPSWSYIDAEGKKRSITKHQVETRLLRQAVRERPKEDKIVRNNVEASIFQLGYHYRSNKSRYRGLIKHKIWASVRCLWVNFRRIMKYLIGLAPKDPSPALNSKINAGIESFNKDNLIFDYIFICLISFFAIFTCNLVENRL